MIKKIKEMILYFKEVQNNKMIILINIKIIKIKKILKLYLKIMIVIKLKKIQFLKSYKQKNQILFNYLDNLYKLMLNFYKNNLKILKNNKKI